MRKSKVKTGMSIYKSKNIKDCWQAPEAMRETWDAFSFTDYRRKQLWSPVLWEFPDSSVGKVSAYNAGDPGSIPGLGRPTGQGIGYPLQYSWASPVAQLVKNSPAMWETWVWSLGWKDPLEKGKVTHSSILDWRILWIVLSMGSQRVGHDWVIFAFHFHSGKFISGDFG